MTKTYTEKDIQILTDHQHIQKRTAMYLGNMKSTEYTIPMFLDNKFNQTNISFIPAVLKCVGEVLDNCIDEHVQNDNKNTIITIDAHPILGTYTISDNGRGVPIGKHASGKHTPEVVFGSLRSGRNFDDNKASGVIGMNGIGSSAVCAVSSEFTVDISRDGKRYQQTFSDGVTKISKPSIKKTTSTETGTTIRFQLDDGVFDDITLPDQLMENRAIELALTNPGITTIYNGKKYKYRKGFDDVIKKISSNFHKFTSDGMEFYVIFDVHEGIDESIFTWVNSSLLFDGGLCNTQFLNAFFDKTISHLQPQAKKTKSTITKNDIKQNLLIIGNLKLSDPEYDAQSKTRLTGPNIRRDLVKMLDTEWAGFVRKHKDWCDVVLERATLRHHNNANADAVKDHKKGIKRKVDGLVDATSKNRFECQLLLTEGDCLHHETQIKVVGDEIENKQLQHVEVGDMVITHNNTIQPVTSKTTVVKPGVKVSYAGGSVTTSKTHRLLTYNTTTHIFGWSVVVDIDPKTHKLVKSKLGEWITCTTIDSITPLIHPKFDFTMVIGGDSTRCSASHEFVVLNVDAGNIERVRCDALNTRMHQMMMFYSPRV